MSAHAASWTSTAGSESVQQNELGLRETEVERNQHRPDPHARELQKQYPRVVGGQHRDSVTAADAEVVGECTRQAGDTVLDLTPRVHLTGTDILDRRLLRPAV